MSPPLFLAPLALALLLSGCLEGEEEIWLAADGSGRFQASYKMPPAIMNSFGSAEGFVDTLKAAAERDKHVDLTQITHRRERGSVLVEFAGTFDDFRMLCTFPKRQLRDPHHPDQPVQSEALFGTIDLKITPLKISYDRSIDLSAVLPKSIKRAPAILDDSTFRYILHLPVEASTSNAANFPDAAQRLEWTFLLKDYASKPMKLHAEGRLPWPRGILLILPLLALLVPILIKHRRKKSDHQ